MLSIILCDSSYVCVLTVFFFNELQVYPCEQCPGGEAARLKNRYLGQLGQCSNYSQRDVLRIFHYSTTKAGLWTGVSDWDDDTKPVCEMTGITCDAHEHVVEIMLKNRRLEGHIPDEIGFLSFLESLDVSDNALMGYVPSDLQWTSITRLDISGNKIRGIIPPLLCMMEELNGNGEDNVFYCDRIACPEGTYNTFGFHHGVNGETCQPCYDMTPFIAQKTCKRTHPPMSHLVELAKEESEKMGVSPGTGLGIFVAISIVAIGLTALTMSYLPTFLRHRQRKWYERGDVDSDKSYSYNDEEEDDDDAADYTFGDEEPDNPRYHPRHHDTEYRDHTDEEQYEEGGVKSADYDDDNMSRSTTSSGSSRRRSALELLGEHKGMALNRRERLKKALSDRVPRSAREAASSLNVHARRFSAQRQSYDGIEPLTPESCGDYYSDEEEENGDDEEFQRDLTLVQNSSSLTASSGDMSSKEKNAPKDKPLQPSDMLDIPMIT